MKRNLLFLFFILVLGNNLFAQWVQVKSLTGGETSCMAKDGNTIYAYVGYQGLVKSTDNGEHWHFVNDSSTFKYYSALSLETEANRIFLKLTGYTGNMYYSVDSGFTWQIFSVNGISGFDDVKLYKGTIIATGLNNYPMYISHDDGITWLTDSTIPSPHYSIEITDGRIFLVPRYGGGSIYTSYDTCHTWVNLGNLPDAISTRSWYPFSAKGDTLAAVVNYFPPYLTISTDLGANWNVISNYVLNWNSSPAVYFDNDTLYLFSNDSIFSTYDLGLTWNFHAYHPGLGATSIIKTDNNLLIGSHNHAFIKFNPSNNTTQKKARGIYAIQLKDIKLKGDTVLIISRDLVYYSYDNSATWKYSIPDKNYYYDYNYLDIDTGAVYVTHNGYIFRSIDWAQTWSIYDTIPNVVSIKQVLYHNGKLYYAAGATVYRGNNQGGTIKKYGNIGSNGVRKIAICNNKLFAISNTNIYATDLVSNPQWSTVNYGIPNPSDFFYMAATDTAIFIGGNSRCVYRCYPPDTTWENLWLCTKGVCDLDAYHKDAFSISKIKVEIQQNSQGIGWTPFNDGLKDFTPFQFAIGDSNMYCGGSGYSFGLYRRSVSDLPVPVSIDETEDENDLYFSVYPNPVSDNLQINGYIQYPQAEIKLIDITGRSCFHKKIFSKGDFTININVDDFSDGIYILNLTDGSNKFSEKIMIRHF